MLQSNYSQSSEVNAKNSTSEYNDLLNATIGKMNLTFTTTPTTFAYNIPTSNVLKEECFTTKEASSGHIASPHYQGQNQLVQCYWMIIVPQGHYVRLKFTGFDLPEMLNGRCIEGFLLYGSYDEQNQKIDGNQFCGDQKPYDYISITNRCWVYYQIMHHKTTYGFELIFDALPIGEQNGSNLSLLALLVIIIPVLAAVFVCYIIKKRKEEQKKTEAEVFERFKKKHMRNRTLLISKRNNNSGKQPNDIQIRVSQASENADNDSEKKRFECDISSIHASGEYAMVPGNFCVRRILLPSGVSADGSVFLRDTPGEMRNSSQSFNYSNNYLSIPKKINQTERLPSYMSFGQPYSIDSLEYEQELRNLKIQQTPASIATANQNTENSMNSLDSIDSLPPYADPPAYHSQTHGQILKNYHNQNRMPSNISDTSVFSNKHPMTLERKKKRRKTYLSSSGMGSANSKRSKYYSLTVNDIKKLSYRSARSRLSSDDGFSYRPGTGHTKFLSSTSVANCNNYIPETNLERGKWEDIQCLNEAGYRGLSSDDCCSVQNLTDMQEMCKTMPVIHVSSFSSIIQEHNTLSYSACPTANQFDSDPLSNSTSTNNENMSLINEEDTSGTGKEFDNPAFEMDESPLQDNKTMHLQRSCSVEGNQSIVDINNNTQINDNSKENRSFVVNEFCPGENNMIVLDQGETMV